MSQTLTSKLHSVRAKLQSKLTVNTKDKKRLSRTCSTAISGLEAILDILNKVAGNAGPPGLQAGITGVLFILDVVKVHSKLTLAFNAEPDDQTEIIPKCR
jgi:hypothetical protein